MFVCCDCCVLSGRDLCDGLITRPGESYRLWRVIECDQETSKTRRLKPATGLWKYNHSGLWRQENKQTRRPITTLDCVVLRDKICSLHPDKDLKLIFDPFSENYQDLATLSNADYPRSAGSCKRSLIPVDQTWCGTQPAYIFCIYQSYF